MTPEDLLTLKRQLSPNAGYKPGEASIPGVTPNKEAYKTYQDVVRDKLKEQMGRAAPADQEAFTQGNKNYGELSTIKTIAGNAGRSQHTLGLRRQMELLGLAGSHGTTHAANVATGVAGAELGSIYGADAIASGLKGASNAAGAAAPAMKAGTTQAGVLSAASLQDPKYGRMLSAMPEQERNVAHATLLQTDSDYRQRQREAANKQGE